MGYDGDFRNPWRESGIYGRGIRYSFARKVTPIVKILLLINIALFVLYALFSRWAHLPLEEYLALKPARVVRDLWIWQLVTYMFLHNPLNPFHLVFNMLVLYFFGPDLESRLGSRRFLLLYLGGGILAGFCFASFHFLGDPHVPALGASGAIMALIVLYAFYWPNRMVIFLFFPLKIKHLAILLVGIDLFYTLLAIQETGIAHIAHLGGALFGFLYFRFEGSVLRWLESMEKRVEKGEYRKEMENKRKVDQLLDKINKCGLGSLSGKERRFLGQMSRKFRDRF